MIRRTLVPLLLVFLVAACSKKVEASKEFKAAMSEFRPAMASFTVEFQKHERAVQKLRDSDPAAAARKIDADIVPLLDDIAKKIEKAHVAGKKYLEAADDEDPALMKQLASNVEHMALQAQGFAKTRDIYKQQAEQLRAGRLTAAQHTQFARDILDAMKLVSGRTMQ